MIFIASSSQQSSQRPEVQTGVCILAVEGEWVSPWKYPESHPPAVTALGFYSEHYRAIDVLKSTYSRPSDYMVVTQADLDHIEPYREPSPPREKFRKYFAALDLLEQQPTSRDAISTKLDEILQELDSYIEAGDRSGIEFRLTYAITRANDLHTAELITYLRSTFSLRQEFAQWWKLLDKTQEVLSMREADVRAELIGLI